VGSYIAGLRHMIESGQHFPGSRVMVDEERLLRTLDNIRSAFVSEMRAARDATQHQKEILAATRAEADTLLTTARRSAEAMITDVGVRAAAEERAEDLLSEATRLASQTEAAAWGYGLDRLIELHTGLREVELTLTQARENLNLPAY
jgi:hypothetical protein